ncbi:hypothetical protein SAMN05421820_117108 [Pedobacter steynii]|uniref:CAAX prenyl protease 2/Lysostaphin resistance protein A-like domain-containing protein n=1 Tax=Pedobacter steynii TaxID=430522 RepID=A0A1H0LBG0_9SPHI|nr:type II CAAX endopeptidase family protein [Pedobacter steynii]NQX43471.1 CPBP family intramembrane metalloprotease [Pedobacter steynii]SDO65599.1 hypothetical protein SAMN05421820_117108 [Pedobacter steynii]
MIVIPYIVIIGIFQFIASRILGLDILEEHIKMSSWQRFVMTLFGAFGTFFSVFLFKRYADKECFCTTGFRERHLYDVFWGVLIGFSVITSGFLTLVYMGKIKYLTNVFLPEDFLLSSCTFILVAASEELFVRGYVLGNLMHSMSKYKALIVSSVFFTLMHGLNSNYRWLAGIVLFLSGILLGLSYLYTGNLWFPIALHFSWNFFQGTIFGFGVSGTNAYSLITQFRHGDTIWNGGSFGFEGSILAVVFQIIPIVIIYLLLKKKQPNLFKNNEMYGIR